MKNCKSRVHGTSSSDTSKKYTHRHLFTARRITPSHRDMNVSPSIASAHTGPGKAEGELSVQGRGGSSTGKMKLVPLQDTMHPISR